jgi:HEAT repeat protein
MVFRGQAPDEVLKASLESDDPKARATAAEALAGRAGDESVARLLPLLQDKDPRVRGTAAQVLGKMKSTSPKIVAALILALDAPDAGARQRLCEALMEITGRDGKYDPKADEAARAKIIADWKAWWAREGK